jgi:Domain of unknown function (DUF397)
VALSDDTPRNTTPTEKGASLDWRKSTWSIANGQCIEAAALADGRLAVRDSMDKSGPIVNFTEGGWHSFLKGIKDGDLDAM